MGAQLFRVNTLHIRFSFAPCSLTTLAICMTGSTFGSGKIPRLPAHSISKLWIRNGATRAQSPSGACAIKASYATSISIWHIVITCKVPRPRCDHFPAGISIQLHPNTCVSTINLISISTLDSKSVNSWWPAGGYITCVLNKRFEGAIKRGRATVIFANVWSSSPWYSIRDFPWTISTASTASVMFSLLLLMSATTAEFNFSLNGLQSVSLNVSGNETKKYGVNPWMWQQTLLPSAVTPNIRMTETGPVWAPGIPGIAIPW